MHILLIVAHGSRRETSNEEVRELVRRMHKLADTRYDDMRCAFLELAQPSIPGAIAQAVLDGAARVDVLPYFLVAGRHVSRDIPELVERAQTAHPDCRVQLLPYLGTHPGVAAMLLASADQSSD